MADDKKGSFTKLILIILIVVIVDIVGGYIIGKKILLPMAYKTDETEEISNVSDVEKKGTVDGTMPGLLRPLDPINLNPANSSGEIFSCQLTLETMDQKVVDELTTRDPQIKDIILNYLSFMNAQELNDVTRREQYRKDLIKKINSVLTTGLISNLYITQWILQF